MFGSTIQAQGKERKGRFASPGTPWGVNRNGGTGPLLAVSVNQQRTPSSKGGLGACPQISPTLQAAGSRDRFALAAAACRYAAAPPGPVAW